MFLIVMYGINSIIFFVSNRLLHKYTRIWTNWIFNRFLHIIFHGQLLNILLKPFICPLTLCILCVVTMLEYSMLCWPNFNIDNWQFPLIRYWIPAPKTHWTSTKAVDIVRLIPSIVFFKLDNLYIFMITK